MSSFVPVSEPKRIEPRATVLALLRNRFRGTSTPPRDERLVDQLDEQRCITNTAQGSRPATRILRTTRSLVVSLLVCLGLPGTAVANSSAGPPPGNSAVNQYLEVVPTASGGLPTGTLGSRNSSRPKASGLSPATRRALAHQGAAGQAVAGLASQAAPTTQRLNHSATTRHVGVAHRSGKVGAGQGKAGQRAASNGSNRTLSGGNAPLSTLAQSITGGSSSGGSAPVLPVVLLIILVGGGAVAVRRRKGLA